ncbi:MAG: GtrA family protein [Verrucomicrobiales bacterium]|nr:GtrA family protein [Verrucomicrobiales bacterium]
MKRKTSWEWDMLARFLVVGILSTAVHFGVMHACLGMSWCTAKSAFGVGFAASFLVSFVLNRNWTFRSEAGVWGSLLRFAIAVGLSYLLAQAVFALTLDMFHTTPSMAFLVALPVPPVSNYILGRYFVFRKVLG